MFDDHSDTRSGREVSIELVDEGVGVGRQPGVSVYGNASIEQEEEYESRNTRANVVSSGGNGGRNSSRRNENSSVEMQNRQQNSGSMNNSDYLFEATDHMYDTRNGNVLAGAAGGNTHPNVQVTDKPPLPAEVVSQGTVAKGLHIIIVVLMMLWFFTEDTLMQRWATSGDSLDGFLCFLVILLHLVAIVFHFRTTHNAGYIAPNPRWEEKRLAALRNDRRRRLQFQGRDAAAQRYVEHGDEPEQFETPRDRDGVSSRVSGDTEDGKKARSGSVDRETAVDPEDQDGETRGDGDTETRDRKPEEDPNGFRFCNLCGVHQPRRAHHCRICNLCVLTFDHHCYWIGGCVGEFNHHRFYLWLMVEALCCAIDAYIVFSGFHAVYHASEWFQRNFLVLIFFCIAVLTVSTVGLLWLYETYLLLTGQTMWEQLKRGKVTYLKQFPRKVTPFSLQNVYGWKGMFYNFAETFKRRGPPYKRWEFLWQHGDKEPFNFFDNEYYDCGCFSFD